MATFFTYRIAQVYPPLQGPTSASTRYVPQFSGDSGVSWIDCYPGDQPQSLLQAQQRLSEIAEAENTFRDEVVAGRLGTLKSYVNFPTVATFFIYRTAEVYSPRQGKEGVDTRYVPEFSGDGGTTWRAIYPGDQPQAILEAQQRLSEVTTAEATFRQEVISGRLGTLSAFVSYP